MFSVRLVYNLIIIRIILVLDSELNKGNKITAINTLAVPMVTYSYGAIHSKLDEN